MGSECLESQDNVNRVPMAFQVIEGRAIKPVLPMNVPVMPDGQASAVGEHTAENGDHRGMSFYPTKEILDEYAEDEEKEEERSREGLQLYQRIKALPLMTADDQKALLDAVFLIHPDHYVIASVMATTCLPLMAVLGLKIRDVNFSTGILCLAQGWGEVGEFVIPNRSRPYHPHGDMGPLVIMLTADVMEMIRQHIKSLAENGQPHDPDAWLFPGRGNQPWKYRYVSASLLEALASCGWPPLFPKDLYYCFLKTRMTEDFQS